MWLKVKKLEFKYQEKYIYENCTFENADHVLIINGKNGVGKTSILNLIYKQNNHKYKGEIFLCGKDLKSFSKKEIRNKISYINQSPILFEQYKVKDNLKILNIDSKKYNHYQSKFYLKKIFDKKVEELSGGEKQILNLCIGLSKESEIIFLDEPLNNLSRENKEIIINILKEDKRKKIIISHEEISIPGQKILVTNRGFNYE